MHTSTSSRLGILAVATVALLSATTVFAQTRTVTSVSSSKRSSSTTSSKSSSVFSAPSAGIDATSGMKVSELPYCGSSKEDHLLYWSAKDKKWSCKTVSSLFPPKCDTKDSVLRYDGTSWKCEVIPGILVAHTATMDDFNGKNTCDTKNTWGGAECTITSNGMGAKLKCPANTLQVDVNALNGYQVGGTYPLFGGEYHAFCYSKHINVVK